jgi:hypothetical protein
MALPGTFRELARRSVWRGAHCIHGVTQTAVAALLPRANSLLQCVATRGMAEKTPAVAAGVDEVEVDREGNRCVVVMAQHA